MRADRECARHSLVWQWHSRKVQPLHFLMMLPKCIHETLELWRIVSSGEERWLLLTEELGLALSIQEAAHKHLFISVSGVLMPPSDLHK